MGAEEYLLEGIDRRRAGLLDRQPRKGKDHGFPQTPRKLVLAGPERGIVYAPADDGGEQPADGRVRSAKLARPGGKFVRSRVPGI